MTARREGAGFLGAFPHRCAPLALGWTSSEFAPAHFDGIVDSGLERAVCRAAFHRLERLSLRLRDASHEPAWPPGEGRRQGSPRALARARAQIRRHQGCRSGGSSGPPVPRDGFARGLAQYRRAAQRHRRGAQDRHRQSGLAPRPQGRRHRQLERCGTPWRGAALRAEGRVAQTLSASAAARSRSPSRACRSLP